MARKKIVPAASGRLIVVIDDSPEFLQSTERILRGDGHNVIAFENPAEALEALRTLKPDLVLVDFFMPQMTGETFVRELRTFNARVQVVLQTGYASDQPPRELLRRLDIQGYYDKSEGPDKLMLWVDVGLKAAFTVQLLEKGHEGLRYILQVTPDLHRIQPLEELLQGILVQMTGLLGVVNAFLAVVAETPQFRAPEGVEGFVALVQDANELVVRAGTGRFHANDAVDASVTLPRLETLVEGRETNHVHLLEDATIVPLLVGSSVIGVIYFDRLVEIERDVELVGIFANQAAVAVHNAQLYDMAAFDPLTGTYSRRFFQHALARELRTAHRGRQPLSLAVVDIDKMKEINDQGGHIAGDAALAAVGRALRKATRATDVVGRYGGDEFVVVMPNTPVEGAELVVARILAGLEDLTVPSTAGRLEVRGSVGLATLEGPTDAGDRFQQVSADAFGALGQELLQLADAGLYKAKRAGRGKAAEPQVLHWNEVFGGPVATPPAVVLSPQQRVLTATGSTG